MSDKQIELGFGGRATENRIFKIQSQSYPEYMFEYHPDTKKVYVIPIATVVFKDGQPFHEAQMLAEHVSGAMEAKNIVAGFIQGYKLGQQIQPRLVVK